MNPNKTTYPICACTVIKTKYDRELKKQLVQLVTNNRVVVTRGYLTKNQAMTGLHKLELAFINMHKAEEKSCKITEPAERFWRAYVQQRGTMPVFTELEK